MTDADLVGRDPDERSIFVVQLENILPHSTIYDAREMPNPRNRSEEWARNVAQMGELLPVNAKCKDDQHHWDEECLHSQRSEPGWLESGWT